MSVTIAQIVLMLEDMVDMGVKVCKRVSKCNLLDSKAGPGVYFKLPEKKI